MGLTITDRHFRLRNLLETPRSNVWMAKCKCGHLAPLPVPSLIKRYGELFPIETAMLHVKWGVWGATGAPGEAGAVQRVKVPPG